MALSGDAKSALIYATRDIAIGTEIADAIDATDSLADAISADSSGNVRLVNTQWDDLRVSVNAVKVSGSKPPTWTSYKSTEVLGFSDQSVAGNEEIVYFSVQMPHAWKEGTDITAHVHWLAEDDTAGNCRWQLTHSWANINGTFPDAATLSVNGAAGAAADKHVLAALGTLTGTGKTLSSMILCSLRRNSSNAGDTLNGKAAYLLEIDFHYQVDKFGSDTEFANEYSA
jgi:hypothetical protein